MFLLFVLFVTAGFILFVAGLAYLANLISVMANMKITVQWPSFVFMVCVSGLFLSLGTVILIRYLPTIFNA